MKRIFGAGLLFLVLSLLSYSYAAHVPAANSYEHKKTGMRVSFPENWKVYSDERSAPDQLKKNFRKDEKGSESLLFIASHPNEQVYSRLLSESFQGSAGEYFELLYENQKEKVGILNARYDVLGDVVQWTFTVKLGQIDLTFVETVAKKEGNIVRLGFWTISPVFEKYRVLFDSIIEKTMFLKKEKGRDVWDAAWKNLAENLAGADLEYVETVERKQPAGSSRICKGEKKSVLWSVKGRMNTVYLFGSIHIGEPSFYPLDAKAESSFKESKHLVVEVDTTSKESQKKAAQLLSDAKLEKGKTLKTVLSPGVYRNLAAEVEKIGLPAGTFDNLKPWITAVSLQMIKMQAMGYVADYGVDKYFLEKAKGDKQVLELENIEDQLKLLEGIGGEKLLAFTLLSLNSAELKTEKMINAWRCGDLQTLEDITFEIGPGLFEDTDDIYEKLFFSRNRKMTEKIKKYLTGDEVYFVVVGSGHLIGEKGIVDLLKKAGYQVTRL
jgi:uncharacterized protein